MFMYKTEYRQMRVYYIISKTKKKRNAREKARVNFVVYTGRVIADLVYTCIPVQKHNKRQVYIQ